MTHLRQKMLDELQRRNLLTEHGLHLPARGRRLFQVFFTPLARQGGGLITSGSIRPICFRERKLQAGDDCMLHSSLAFPLRQDAATPVSRRAHPISQAPQAIARCTQSRRRPAAD